MIAFAIVAHWLACIWYVIGLSEIANKSTVCWLYALGEAISKPYNNFTQESGPDEGSAYVTALYFTLTSMTTVGFGNVAANTNSEKIFAVITMLIGGLLSIGKKPLHLYILACCCSASDIRELGISGIHNQDGSPRILSRRFDKPIYLQRVLVRMIDP